MKKKEEKARAIRQQIIADMHNTNNNNNNTNNTTRNTNTNNNSNNKVNLKQHPSASATTKKGKFVCFQLTVNSLLINAPP